MLTEHGPNETNSVGGIVRHVCEHVSRNTNSMPADTRRHGGIENYFPDTMESPEELVQNVETTFTGWSRAIAELIAGEGSAVDLHRTYHLVEHTSYHLGEIVDRA